jgi:hypothetical protein
MDLQMAVISVFFFFFVVLHVSVFDIPLGVLLAKSFLCITSLPCSLSESFGLLKLKLNAAW